MIPSLSRKGPVKLSRPLVLVGLMGAGKTTVGKRLAQRLRVPFYDADEEIETAAGMSISDIFETYGEAHFRDGERRVIERLIAEGPHVLATGGGAFMNEKTRALVKREATSIWLKASLDTLVKRTEGRSHRPLLNQGNPREILARLLAEREPVYAKADITVPSVEGPHSRTVEKIIKALQARQRQDKPQRQETKS